MHSGVPGRQYSANQPVNTGSRGELETTPLRTFGYVIREVSYLILGKFGGWDAYGERWAERLRSERGE